MSYLRRFVYSPGGEVNGGVDTRADDTEDPKDVIPENADAIPEARTPAEEETGEEKPVIDKIREALQDWSNKDEADQEFDDTRV